MYAIRLNNEPLWTIGGKEILYATEQEAEQALIEEMEECKRAYQFGYMEDEGDFDNHRIVEVL